jgi:hypothetical protein
MHPFMSNDIAKARSDEKLTRGLAAYRALSAREEQAAEVGPEAGGAGRLRLVDRLRRRGDDASLPARPAI